MPNNAGDTPGLRRRVLLGAAALGVPVARAAATRPVRVFSTTDQPVVQPLIEAFERGHRDLRVDYVQLGSVELFERLGVGGDRTADVTWSSAMDLQIKLVNDGHAVRHASPHAAQLPRWAVWKHEAYATTYEPVGIAYHRGLWADAELPRSHAALTALLLSDTARFRRRVATYDIERAGLGYLLAAHDTMASRRAWDLVHSLAAAQASLHADTQSMLESVGAGRALLAYNVLGTYAEAFARKQPALAVIYPSDYTLIASRVAFVARHAPNPEGARRWLDHLLSPAGQVSLGDDCGLYPVRDDVASARAGLALQRLLGVAARPIALGPGLLAPLDRSRHTAMLKRWRDTFAAAS